MNPKKPQSTSPTLIHINETLPYKHLPRFALFEFAFRPFFLFAVLFSLIHLLLWVMIWLGKVSIPTLPIITTLTPFLWHGHEMVFGYGYGVIIGFLLTAVTNWTGQKTPIRLPLALMFTLWLIARIGFITGGYGFIVAVVSESALGIWVLWAFTAPVIISGNQRQWGFVGKLALFIVANGLFYLGIFGVLSNAGHHGVFLGLYLVLAVVMVMGRRVIPFFTKRALGLSGDIANPRWLDLSSLVLFTLFCLWDVFFTPNQVLGYLSLGLFILYSIRLFNWYQSGLFKHTLIWVLWVANAILFSGFLLKALSIFMGLNPFLAIHAFALGGVGVMTFGMMSRVSLGHTGRNVFKPSRLLIVIFLLLVLTAVVRVILPLFWVEYYRYWIMISATLWVIAGLIFLIIYTPILIRPRADGKPG